MINEELTTEKISKPRFEFRTFGQNFDTAAKRMSRLSMPVPEEYWERFSDEMYIVASINNVHNVKIREDKLDIKTLLQTVEGFEQWYPLMTGDFPITVEVLEKDIFQPFQVSIPRFMKKTYSYDEFMEIIQEHPDLQLVHVHKQRFGYLVNDTLCEMGVVLINGAKVLTISSESTDIEAIKKTIKDIGLEGIENINYLQAIKRVIGMIDKPLAS
jgi:hypothetical protein